MSVIKKIVLSLVLLTTLASSLLAPVAQAQGGLDLIFGNGPWYYQRFPQFYSKVYDKENETEIFGERYTAAQVQWVFYSIAGFLFTLAVGQDVGICVLSGDVSSCFDALIPYTNDASLADINLQQKKGRFVGFSSSGRKANISG